MNKLIICVLLMPLFYEEVYSQENVLKNIMQSAQSINSDLGKQISKAKSHDKAGLIKEAEMIYHQLFSNNPTSLHVFSSYKSFLVKHKNWESLLNISLIYASKMGDDAYAKLALADTYFIVNKNNDAILIFDELFSIQPSDSKKLKRYLSKLIQYNQIDYALNKIKYIRKNNKDKGFYSDKLGNYFYSNMQFEMALSEYLLFISTNDDNMGYIRKKLMSFPDEPKVVSLIRLTLNKDNTRISKILLAEYEFKWKNYEKSYDLMIANYNSIKTLHDFAQNLIVANQLELAEKIYRHLSESENKEVVMISIYEMANILEIKSNQKTNDIPLSNSIIDNSFFEIQSCGSSLIDMDNLSIVNIVNLYDSLVVSYNHSDAQYKLSTLKMKSNYDFESLIKDFVELEKKSIDRETRFKSAINIIELKILNGFADEELLKQINNFKKKYNKKNQKMLLDLKLNQVLFYLNKIDLLRENLVDKLKIVPKDNIYYNNFIDGMILVMLFNNKDKELKNFSEAIYNIKKMEYNKALQGFTNLSMSENPSIVNLSLYFQSYIHIMQKSYNLSNPIVSKIKENDIFSQLTLLMWAEIDDYIHDDKNAAIDKYLEFLDKYETSIFYENIRIRLGEIIG